MPINTQNRPLCYFKCINHIEPVHTSHYAHSYVRGYAQPATTIDISVESHAMCVAAEESRLSGEKVTLQ